jgi:hypothetical protein
LIEQEITIPTMASKGRSKAAGKRAAPTVSPTKAKATTIAAATSLSSILDFSANTKHARIDYNTVNAVLAHVNGIGLCLFTALDFFHKDGVMKRFVKGDNFMRTCSPFAISFTYVVDGKEFSFDSKPWGRGITTWSDYYVGYLRTLAIPLPPLCSSTCLHHSIPSRPMLPSAFSTPQVFKMIKHQETEFQGPLFPAIITQFCSELSDAGITIKIAETVLPTTTVMNESQFARFWTKTGNTRDVLDSGDAWVSEGIDAGEFLDRGLEKNEEYKKSMQPHSSSGAGSSSQ